MKPDYEDTVLRYKNTVYKIAFASCKCREDADDVFQEVFLKLLTFKKDFESEEHLKAWLIRVTVNCCRLTHRSKKLGKRAELSENIPAEGLDEDCGCDSAAVIASVRRLPEKYRPIIIMFYYEEMPAAKIAKMLGMNEATVRTRLRRARGLLRKDLSSIWQNEQEDI